MNRLAPHLPRRLARAVGRLLVWALPQRLQTWAQAMAAEIDHIPSDGEALAFAIDCAFAALRMASPLAGVLHSPRRMGLCCALDATLIGCLYMAAAGAPQRYLVLNGVSLAAAVALYATLRAVHALEDRARGALVLAMGLALVATALWGPPLQDVSRWVRLGPLSLHVGMMLLPFMLVASERLSRPGLADLGLAAAAAAVALQPDPAMAGALAAGLVLRAWQQRHAHTLLMAAIGLASLAFSLARPDPLPATPFVEGVVVAAFHFDVAAGLAVLAGQLLLLLPAVLPSLTGADADLRAPSWQFGVIWLALIAAALLGNYPTPLVGYGGSAMIGYLLSLSALPPRRAGAGAGVLDESGQRPEGGAGPVLRVRQALGARRALGL